MHVLEAYIGVFGTIFPFRGTSNLVIWHIALCLRSSESVGYVVEERIVLYFTCR